MAEWLYQLVLIPGHVGDGFRCDHLLKVAEDADMIGVRFLTILTKGGVIMYMYSGCLSSESLALDPDLFS